MLLFIKTDNVYAFSQAPFFLSENKNSSFFKKELEKFNESSGPTFKMKNDPRIYPMGRILRKFSLDELPQLLNIFMGEMSFVGPRPERPTVYDDLDGKVENFRSRMQVMPGLTGYAQVNGGYDLNPAEKLKYDLIYINHCSVLFDLWCLLKTIPVVFTMKGAR